MVGSSIFFGATPTDGAFTGASQSTRRIGSIRSTLRASIKLDRAELERHPEGYRHLAYVQSRAGSTVTTELPTSNSEALVKLYADGATWLSGSATSV